MGEAIQNTHELSQSGMHQVGIPPALTERRCTMSGSLLAGAVDMHCHAGPSLFNRDLDFVTAAQEADAAGMRAIVVKDHLFPSVVALAVLESRTKELVG